MAILHDVQARSSIEQRVRALTPQTRPRWGKMSVDQMLWHVNQAMGLSLGEVRVGPGGPTMPPALMKFLVIRMPWPKGAPTHPDFVAQRSYDFATERDRALRLISDLTTKPINEPWPVHPAFGRMSGREVSALTHKHLNHHLTQFGV
jgi:hypothetical protein